MSSLSGFSDSEWPVSDSDTSSIEWLSEPEEEPVDDSTYIESSKKLRQTKARQQPRIPRRKNAFFDHFDPTIRSMIYAHLVFDPIKRLHRSPVGIDGSALARTCRQARKEARGEADHQLRAFFKCASDVYKQKAGHEIRLTKALVEDSLAGVKELTMICTGTIPQPGPNNQRVPKPINRLLRLHLRTLTLHFVGDSKRDGSMDMEALQNFMNNTLDCIIEDSVSSAGPRKPYSDVLIRCLTVSWDFRSNPLDKVRIAGRRIAYERNGKRKHAAFGQEHSKDGAVGRVFVDAGGECELISARLLVSNHLPRALREGSSGPKGPARMETEGVE